MYPSFYREARLGLSSKPSYKSWVWMLEMEDLWLMPITPSKQGKADGGLLLYVVTMLLYKRTTVNQSAQNPVVGVFFPSHMTSVYSVWVDIMTRRDVPIVCYSICFLPHPRAGQLWLCVLPQRLRGYRMRRGWRKSPGQESPPSSSAVAHQYSPLSSAWSHRDCGPSEWSSHSD